MSRPRIGISCDHEMRAVRTVPTAHHVLSGPYVEAVLAAGGLPFVLPNVTPEAAVSYAERLDGLVLSGGDFDVDPALYGHARHEKLGAVKPERTTFETALLSAALERGMPVLGVCGGMQVINVARGGTLYQDLPSERPGPVAHTQVGDKREAAHQVQPMAGGLLATLVGVESLPVNSTHHQAVWELGRRLQVEAVSEDGVIEALSDPSLSFFLGVQWHPESMRQSERHMTLYRALIDAARAFVSR
jgi:putative glutamine amidotransferase